MAEVEMRGVTCLVCDAPSHGLVLCPIHLEKAARKEGRRAGLEEAARIADEEANALEKALYRQGTLPDNFYDVNKWRFIAAAIRSRINEKEG